MTLQLNNLTHFYLYQLSWFSCDMSGLRSAIWANSVAEQGMYALGEEVSSNMTIMFTVKQLHHCRLICVFPHSGALWKVDHRCRWRTWKGWLKAIDGETGTVGEILPAEQTSEEDKWGKSFCSKCEKEQLLQTCSSDNSRWLIHWWGHFYSK